MRLYSIFVTDDRFPLFGTPLFVDDRGSLYSQISLDGSRISSFGPIQVASRQFSKIDNIGHDERNVGDLLLYCIALKEGWFWVGDCYRMRADFSEMMYRSAIQNSPFLRLEMGRLLEDKQMIKLASIDGAKKLAKYSLRIANLWRKSSQFEADLELEIDAALQLSATKGDHHVAIRMSLPKIAMSTIDQFAKHEHNYRSTYIRRVVDKFRNELINPSFWRGFREKANELKHKLYFGRSFIKDHDFREILIGDILVGKRYISKNVFHSIGLKFDYHRATIRIQAADQVEIFENYNDTSIDLGIYSIEEFYGLVFLYMAILDKGSFQIELTRNYEALFEDVRARIVADVRG